MGWGGRRPGAGAKPKALRERALLARSEQVLPPAEPVDAPPPAELTEAERAVWLRQAPHAVAARTLTPGTALSFARYCRLVVLEEALAVDRSKAGGPDHRGVLQRINALELQFLLTPVGKPLVSAAPTQTATPLDRYLNRRPVS